MHLMKCKASDIKNVLEEAAREHQSKVGTIDQTRTHLNYNLAPEDNRIHSADEMKQHIKELGVSRKIRSDAVLCYSTIIDIPKDYTGDTAEFFYSAYNALKQELCNGHEEYVLQAYVHLDEKTPHMHFASVPIIEKDGKRKLSAKDITGTKTFLRSFHPHIEQAMSEDLGREVHLYDPEKVEERQQARAKGDRSKDYKTLEEYKADKAKEAYHASLGREINGLESDLSLITETYNNTAEVLGKRQQELNTATEVLGKTKQEIASNKAQIDDLRLQIDTGNKNLIETTKRLNEANNELTDIKQEIKHYTPIQKFIQNLKEIKEKLKNQVTLYNTIKELKTQGFDRLYNRQTDETIQINDILEKTKDIIPTYMAVKDLVKQAESLDDYERE